MSLPLRRVLRVLAFGGLAALSLPGVRAARADTDLVPPVAQLFSWNTASAPPAGPATCAASQAAAMPMAELRRQAALARIAAVVKAEPGSAAEPLNGRGYAYPVQRDPNAELRRVVLEAQRQRALRAAGGLQ
jgi:hypothetical protein